MIRDPRPRQGWLWLVGLGLIIPFLLGQGCPSFQAPVNQGSGTEQSADNDTNTDTTQTGTGGVDNPAGGQVTPEAVPAQTVRVLFPNGGERIEVGAIVEVLIFAFDSSNPNPQVRVFFDTDTNPSNGYTLITPTPVVATGNPIPWATAGRATGSYYIGVELFGTNPTIIDYSDASFELVPAGQGPGGPGDPGGPGGPGTDMITLTVSTPRLDLTILETQTFTIRWSTSLTPGQGTVRIFREPDFDEDGIPDGQGLRATIGTTGIDAAQQIFRWNTTGVRGRYFIGVTLTPNEGDIVEAYSLGTVRILPLSFWVGDLGTKLDENKRPIPQTTPFQGAVMQGFNFRDNLGSAMIPVDDYDDDGLNEIVFAAQYGKPFLFAQGGKGAGEAYMIYGSTQRLRGDFNMNGVGQPTLPGVIFPGILPNPNEPNTLLGNPLGYQVDGGPPAPFSTEGLRGLVTIPDQDNDGKRELVFSFPWCDSYSLQNQIADGTHPWPINNLGRLENNGHFLRGGVVMVSSQNSLLNNRAALSRHLDRVLQLQEVGQVFSPMGISPTLPAYRAPEDRCVDYVFGADGADTVSFPCEGFWQDTTAFISPLRLADPFPATGHVIAPDPGLLCTRSYPGGPFYVDLNAVDAPPGPTSLQFFEGHQSSTSDFCNNIRWPLFGFMSTLGSGFYATGNNCADRTIATPREPYGCRILGQVTTQLFTPTPTTANRFGASISRSGDFLLIGAPLRTARVADVPSLPEATRFESGQVYMLSLRRPGSDSDDLFWSTSTETAHDDIPAPHNFIIKDLGYTKTDGGGGSGNCGFSVELGGPAFEMIRPIQIVGAAPTDRVGEVTGLYDINGDGVDDVAVGGAGTNSGRGAVYVVYRRQPEIENDYLLERLQYAPTHPDRLNGLMIIGEQGENLGTAIAGIGPAALNDDYNNDGDADLLIGVPNATPATGAEAGQVFILFGGRNLLNREGGVTIAELRASGDGMLITGAEPGDRAGETVAPAGDVNGDGIADLLIAAPDANPPAKVRVTFQYDSDGNGTLDATGLGIDLNGDGEPDPLNDNNDTELDGTNIPDADDDLTGCGVVYVVYGGKHLTGTINLREIGGPNLPGLTFMGRAAGDHLGGGLTQNGLLSRGVSAAGDLDGDGRDDIMISSILASPEGKVQAGEVYVVYGFGP